MKKVLFLMFAAASFTFASCDSPKENSAENAADNVEAAGEAKADVMEDQADAVRDTADKKADKMEDDADKMDGAGAGNMDGSDTKMDAKTDEVKH